MLTDCSNWVDCVNCDECDKCGVYFQRLGILCYSKRCLNILRPLPLSSVRMRHQFTVAARRSARGFRDGPTTDGLATRELWQC